MAQKITVALQDDLDGGPADETVRFAIGGAGYEIDLSATNAAAFRRQRSGGIRAWAKQAGITVSERGESPPASSSNTTPPPSDPDPRRHGATRASPAQMACGPGGVPHHATLPHHSVQMRSRTRI